MWGYYGHTRHVIEQQLTESGFPERNFSDLFPRWLGTRELLLHGRDPYSPEITGEIQQGYYGRTTVKWLFTAILLASAVWTVLLWIQALGVRAGRSEVIAYIFVALATLP